MTEKTPDSVSKGFFARLVTAPHRTIQDNAGWLVVVFFLLEVRALYFTDLESPNWGLHAAIILFGIASGVLAFTRPITRAKDPDTVLNVIFRIGYGFIFLVVASAIFFTFFYQGTPFLTPSAGKDLPPSRSDDCDSQETKRDVESTDQESAVVESSSGDTSKCNKQGEDRQGRLAEKQTQGIPYISKPIMLLPGCDFGTPMSVREGRLLPSPNAESDNRETDTPRRRESVGRNQRDSMPEGAFCGDLPPQWVLTIGGAVMSCYLDGTCPDILTGKDGLDSIQAIDDRIDQLSKDQAATRVEIGALTNKRDLARREADYRAAKARIDSSAAQQPLQHTGWGAADIEKLAAKEKELALQSAKLESLRKRRDEEGRPIRNIAARPIVGGVVVPIYFLVLATLGALVQMMRKLPEYHYRATKDYPQAYEEKAARGEEPQPPLTPEEARDFVVFQMLQVMSAPVIAIVAYSWAEPERVSATVILAFAAGFSTEVILMAVRGMTDRLLGLGLRGARYRAALQPRVAADVAAAVPDVSVPSVEAWNPADVLRIRPYLVGDAVVLVQPVGSFQAGAEGVVVAVNKDGTIAVKATKDADGKAREERLPNRGPEFFAPLGTLMDPDQSEPKG